MKIPALLALGLALLSSMSAAAPITVRSGEHETFSRLVFSLPQNQNGWQLQETRAGYALSLTDKDAEFLTAEVFQRIDRNRLIDLRPTGQDGQLELVLGCACKAKAFTIDGNLLVVDIHDPEPEDQDTAEKHATAGQNVSGDESPTRTLSFSTAAMPLFTPSQLSLGEEAPVEQVMAEVPLSLPGFPDTDPAEMLTRRSRSAFVRKQLLEQLGRAATQGLLQPVEPVAIPKPAPAVSNGHSLAENTPARPVEPNPAETLTTRPNINISTETSINRDVQASLDRTEIPDRAQTCPNDSLFAFEAWATADPMPAQIGHWRKRLFSQTDRVDTNALISLSRLYLHFGFGAEAWDVLKLGPDDSQEIRVNRVLARLVDGLQDRALPDLDGLMHCNTRAALWSVLAEDTIHPSDEVDVEAVLAAFSALPAHLRRHIGPDLARRLMDFGDENAAQATLAFARRGGKDPDPGLALAEARIDLSEGQTDKARQTLSAVVQADRDMSPTALVALVQSHDADDLPLPPETAALVAAYALEHRSGSEGPALRNALVMARALAGQFVQGHDALTEIEKRDGNAAAFQTRSYLFDKLALQADEIGFLRLVLSQIEDLADKIDRKTGNAVAERLIDLGFARQAGVLLRGSASGENGRQRRLLRSRVALAEYKPRNAEAELLGLTGRDVDHLRARARQLSGDHGVAQTLFASLDHLEDAERAAWLASDWAALAQSSDPAYAAIATLAQDAGQFPASDPENAADPARILARNRALLQESAASRDVLSSILSKHEVTVALGN